MKKNLKFLRSQKLKEGVSKVAQLSIKKNLNQSLKK